MYLLSLLFSFSCQDSTFEELLEAANSMTLDEKRTRLAQLKVKRSRLELSKHGEWN